MVGLAGGLAFAISVVLALSGVAIKASAQQDSGQLHTIGIYHVAPGKHLDFLRWQAEREALAKEAGAPPVQWYVHTDGDSWDFVSMGQDLDDGEDQAALDEKIEELTRQKGLTTGFAAGLEFRQFVASHTDTEARGPFTAQELVEQGTRR